MPPFDRNMLPEIAAYEDATTAIVEALAAIEQMRGSAGSPLADAQRRLAEARLSLDEWLAENGLAD